MTKKIYGADIIVDSLKKHHIDYVFGIPGAKIDRLFEALEADPDAPKLIVTRHEQNAAFMAQAYSRLTGKTGVVIATSGPGVGNLVTGLMTAQAEGDAVLAIGGQVQRKDQYRQTHQSTSSVEIFRPITNYAAEVQDPENISEIMANAFEATQGAKRGAAFVSIPQDVDDSLVTGKPLPVYQDFGQGPAAPDAIETLAQEIKQAKLPVILVGMRGSSAEVAGALQQLISETHLPVVETFQAAGVVSRQFERQAYFGRVGLFRNQVGDKLLKASDLVITVGYDAIEYEPRNWNVDGQLNIAAIDTTSAQIDNNYIPSLQLIGNIATTLRQLSYQLLNYQISYDAQQLLDQYKAELDSDKKAPRSDSDDINDPLAVVQATQKVVNDDTIVSVDVGSHYIWMARHFRSYKPRHLLISNGMQTLGVGLPWAMVAALLHPEKKAIAVVGDGGLMFSGAELSTAVALGLDIMIIVWNDGGHYDMVRFQEEKKYGKAAGVNFGQFDNVLFAQAAGATGLRVDKDEDLAKVFRQAYNTKGPVVVDVPVDYSHNIDLANQIFDSEF